MVNVPIAGLAGDLQKNEKKFVIAKSSCLIFIVEHSIFRSKETKRPGKVICCQSLNQ